MNHAGTFGKSGDAEFFAVDFEAGEGGFFDCIGGENGLCGLLEVSEPGAYGSGQGREGGDELFSRQGDADDAG